MNNSENKNILLITSRADYGGGPEHLYQLLELKNKFNLFIAAPNDTPYFSKYKEKLSENSLFIIPHRKFTLRSFFQLRAFIKKKKINIIHSHGKGAGIYSRLLSIVVGVKCVHTFHGVHVQNYGVLLRSIYKVTERILSFFTDRFIVVSESEKRKVLKYKFASQDKFRLIQNGTAIPLDSDINKGKFNSRKILHISRFDYAKNSLLMGEIIKKINETISSTRFEFILIGKGTDKKLLENKLKELQIENVRFVGFQKDVKKYYNESFCLISTSRWEGLPLVVLEAMAYGLPVIASNVEGNIDLIEDSRTGFLYDLDSPETAAESISYLMGDSERYKKISSSAREVIKEKYSRENMIKQTENLYLSLL